MIRFFRLNVPQIRVLLSFVLAVALTLPIHAQEPDIDKGKSLFNMNCAACHKLNKRAVGPALAGVSQKYEKEWLYSWIKNSMAMVKSGDVQAVAIYEEYNKSVMTAFPQLSNEDIDNILAYTDYTPPAPAMPAPGDPPGAAVASDVHMTSAEPPNPTDFVRVEFESLPRTNDPRELRARQQLVQWHCIWRATTSERAKP